MANEVTIELKVKDDELKRSLKTAEGAAKKSGRRISAAIGGGFRRLGRALTSFQAQIIAVGGALVAAFASKQVLEAAARQEDAVNSLNSALVATGKFSRETSQAFQDFASSLQDATGFGDEYIIENAALIQSLGDLTEKGLERATTAALDMAIATGRDLRTAAELVGKAAAGEVSSFSRFGIVIQKGATNAETLDKALTALETKFGGAAERSMNTFSGAIRAVVGYFGDLQEQIGFLITKSPVITAVIKEIALIFKEATKSMVAFNANNKKTNNFLVNVVTTITQMIRIFFKVIATVKLLSDALFLIPLAIVRGLAYIPQLFINMLDKVIDIVSSFIENLATKIGGPLAGKLVASVTGMMKGPLTAAKKGIDLLDDGVKVFSESASNNLKTIMGQEDQDSFTGRANQFLSRIDQAAIVAGAKGRKLGKNLMDGVNDELDEGGEDAEVELTDLEKKVRKIFGSGLTNLVSTSIQSLGASLVQGADAFSNFSGNALNIIGDMAIQIGTTMIAIGEAIDALKTSLTSFFGGSVIAAGIALIAIGGLLKSLSSGGGGSNTSTAGGPGAAVPGAQPGTEIQQPVSDQVADREPQPTVSVTVQGNILDRKQAGLELVNVINDAIGIQNAKIIGLNA